MWYENNINITNDANEIVQPRNISLSQIPDTTKLTVCIHLQYPYAYRKGYTQKIKSIEKRNINNDVVGFYYEMWKNIRDDMKLHTNGTIQFEETFIEEDEVAKIMSKQTHLSKTSMNDYDIVIGLYNANNFPILNQNGSKGPDEPKITYSDIWSFSDPIFLRDYTVITKRVDRMNQLFTQMFLKKYLPIMLVFIIISLVLGNVLYQFTPRKSRQNAVWQMLSGMMGEFGYLSEKLSDHYKKTTWVSYLVNTIMLMICLYCFIYIQATINTTMIYSKNTIQRASLFTDMPHEMRVGFPSHMKVNVEKYIEPITEFKLIELPMTYDDAFHEYIIQPQKTTNENKQHIDGILVDIIKFRYDMYNNPHIMKDMVMVDVTFGKHPISLATNNRSSSSSSSLSSHKTLDAVNAAIRRLHRRGMLQKTCDYYMKENSKQHCI